MPAVSRSLTVSRISLLTFLLCTLILALAASLDLQRREQQWRLVQQEQGQHKAAELLRLLDTERHMTQRSLTSLALEPRLQELLRPPAESTPRDVQIQQLATLLEQRLTPQAQALLGKVRLRIHLVQEQGQLLQLEMPPVSTRSRIPSDFDTTTLSLLQAGQTVQQLAAQPAQWVFLQPIRHRDHLLGVLELRRALLDTPHDYARRLDSQIALLGTAAEGHSVPWTLLSHSNSQALSWLKSASLPAPAHDQPIRTQLLLRTQQQVIQTLLRLPEQPLLSVLLWQDIHPAYQQFQNSQRAQRGLWLVIWLSSSLLLLGALHLLQRTDRHARQQQAQLQDEQRQAQANAERHLALLSTLHSHTSRASLFEWLPGALATLTDSPQAVVFDWQEQPPKGYSHGMPSEPLHRAGQAAGEQQTTLWQSLEAPFQPLLALAIADDAQPLASLALGGRCAGYSSDLLAHCQTFLDALSVHLQRLAEYAQQQQQINTLQRRARSMQVLGEITQPSGKPLTVRLQRALELGARFLKLPLGLINQLRASDFQVLASHSTAPELQLTPGQALAFEATLCSQTLQINDVLSIDQLATPDVTSHAAPPGLPVQSYLGVAVQVKQQPYATLCFASSQPRSASFDEIDREFIRLLARWVAHSLETALLYDAQQHALDRLDRLTAQVPGGVFQYQAWPDGHSDMPYLSAGTYQLLGLPPSEPQHFMNAMRQALHPADHQLLRDSLRQSARQQSLLNLELRLLQDAQAPRWLLYRAMPQRQADGSVVWSGFITDISEDKRRTRLFDQQRQSLLSVIDSIDAGTWELQLPSGATTINERWAHMLGYALAELQPVTLDTWRSLVHPEDLPEAEQQLQEHFQGIRPLYQCQLRMRHKAGHWLWVETRGRVIHRDAQGAPLSMYGTHMDVSQQRREQDEISSARAFLQTVIDAPTPVSIIATDKNGLFTLFNAGAERLLGYPRQDLLGKHSPALFHDPQEVEARAAELSQQTGQPINGFETFVHLARQGRNETRQWTYIHRNGQRHPVSLSVSPILDSQQQLTGFLGIAMDLTEQLATSQALIDSEARYRSMLDNLPGAVYRCRNDASWSMLLISEEIEHITGYPASDFIDNAVRSFASIVLPEDLPITYATLEAVQQRRSFNLSYRIQHAQGHVVWVNEQGRGEYDAENNLQWIDGFIWDSSELHQAEAQRQALQQRLNTFYQVAPVAIALNRLDDGQFIDGNPELFRLTGYTKEEFRTLSYWDITPESYASDEQRQLRKLQESGTYGPYEKVYISKSGQRIPVLLHGALISGEQGEPLIWSIIQDISSRVQAEQAQQEREQYLSAVLDNVIDAIITIDAQGIIQTFNAAAERIFAYPASAVVGRNVSCLMPAPHQLAHDSYLQNYLRTGQARIIGMPREVEGLRSHGETFPLELAVSEIRHNGMRRFIGVIRDLSEVRRVERMKREFVATVSHELRTPLTAISGALALVNAGVLGELPAQASELLRVAQQNSQQLNLLINDLLDMEKLLVGKMRLDMQPHSLSPLLQQALLTLNPYAEQFAVTLQLEDHSQNCQVNVDSQRLQQVLANLLSNAIKFSPRGAPVSLAAALQGDHVRLSVTDQGPGIAPEFHAQIFHQFSQADASDAREKGGTGLGLAISKELIERMGGTIAFSSTPGQGACFWVELPVAEHTA